MIGTHYFKEALMGFGSNTKHYFNQQQTYKVAKILKVEFTQL